MLSDKCNVLSFAIRVFVKTVFTVSYLFTLRVVYICAYFSFKFVVFGNTPLKRKRDPTFTTSERDVLITLVGQHFDVLESKKTDAKSIIKKNEEWKKVSQEFKTISTVYPRHWIVLKNCWLNLKKRARQRQTLRTQHFLKTGMYYGFHFLIIHIRILLWKFTSINILRRRAT